MAARTVGTGMKVFYDSFSQPSRAVLLLLNANKVQYEPRMIKIAKGTGKRVIQGIGKDVSWFFTAEHRTNEELIVVNPNKQVPAISDNGFHLFERQAGIAWCLCPTS